MKKPEKIQKFLKIARKTKKLLKKQEQFKKPSESL